MSSALGSVDSLWRYPVKSMHGEQIEEAFVGFAGVYGDRLFAFRDSANPKGFPYLTGREQQEMVLYRPRFRNPEKAAKPPNLADAEGIEPGLTPLFAAPEELAVNVETPSGEPCRRPGLAFPALRSARRRTYADAVALGPRDDGLPTSVAVLTADSPPTRRRDRRRHRQAAVPGQHLHGLG